jgi:hypothetical protein
MRRRKKTTITGDKCVGKDEEKESLPNTDESSI